VDDLLRRLRPCHSPEELIGLHQTEPWLLELAAEPRLLDLIEAQVGPDVVLWSTHLLCKPPRTGTEVPWHQDAPYWNVTGPLAGAVWIPLDDIDEDNGAMAILPGWHDKGVLPRRTQDGKFFSQEIDPSALPADVAARQVRYALRAGQMAIHDTMIPHTSVPNRSARWRRVIILRYMAAAGGMGEKDYVHPISGEAFARQYWLMRGRDVQHRGLKRLADAGGIVARSRR